MAFAARPSSTGFAAGALQAAKLGMSAAGSSRPPLGDPAADSLSASRQAVSRFGKEMRIGVLRDAIRKIEGHHRFGQSDAVQVAGAADDASLNLWSFGCRVMDLRLPGGLACDAVHEVKGAAHPTGASVGDWMAGLGFALRLAVRRQRMLERAAVKPRGPWLLWCTTRAFTAEYGRLSVRGLQRFGIDPGGVLIVETAREEEALQALEEGLRSQSLGLACGVFGDVALTPARRLSLAAKASETPCLLVTHPSSPVAAATASRFTVSRQRSAPHPLDPKAPGRARFAVRLDRCRAAPRSAGKRSLPLEWCDDARTFSLAAGVGHRAFGAGEPLRRAEG